MGAVGIDARMPFWLWLKPRVWPRLLLRVDSFPALKSGNIAHDLQVRFNHSITGLNAALLARKARHRAAAPLRRSREQTEVSLRLLIG